jgi:signal transduction histidine kinase
MGSIYLVEDQDDVLIIKAHRGYDEAVLAECSRVPFGKCLCGVAAATSTPIFADCHRCYQGIFPHGHYCIPIVSGKKVLGVLNLVLKEGHLRDKQEEEFFSSIAATLAGIIEHRKTESEKERLQHQLVESEKLTALGRMMENVAHEIRNPLTVVGGLVRRLDKKIPAETKDKEYTRVILSESVRLERILKSILLLTKEPSPRKEEYDIHGVIEESLRSFETSFVEKSIEIQKIFALLPTVPMDRENVREVVDNLLANAVYATPAGGKITIATDREYLGERVYVTVKVTNTGSGIAPDMLGRIFEPFFTTKPVGPDHGIGLGLSIARKIMEEHGGLIRVESKVGEGTTFSLFFPIYGLPPSPKP